MTICRVILQDIGTRRVLFGGQMRKTISLDTFCLTNAPWPGQGVDPDPEPLGFWDDSLLWNDDLNWSDE